MDTVFHRLLHHMDARLETALGVLSERIETFEARVHRDSAEVREDVAMRCQTISELVEERLRAVQDAPAPKGLSLSHKA